MASKLALDYSARCVRSLSETVFTGSLLYLVILIRNIAQDR